jgi:hypothetical protein
MINKDSRLSALSEIKYLGPRLHAYDQKVRFNNHLRRWPQGTTANDRTTMSRGEGSPTPTGAQYSPKSIPLLQVVSPVFFSCFSFSLIIGISHSCWSDMTFPCFLYIHYLFFLNSVLKCNSLRKMKKPNHMSVLGQ